MPCLPSHGITSKVKLFKSKRLSINRKEKLVFEHCIIINRKLLKIVNLTFI